MNAMRRSITIAALTVTAAACDSPSEPHMGLQPVTLEAVGDTRQLEASVTGSDRLPEWESLDPGVATVTRAGMVTAVSPGVATVRARIGSSMAEGRVTVLPAAAVEVSTASRSLDPSGTPTIATRLKNTGGRGFFRTEYWVARATPDGEHSVVLRDLTDNAAPVGMDIESQVSHPGMVDVDWIVVFTRDAHSVEYRATSCIRLDGAAPCPLP